MTNPLRTILLVFLLGSCAHKQTFTPEVQGPGVIFSHDGVIYSIPPGKPVLKMKLVSLGLNQDNLLHMKMYFIVEGKARHEYLDPTEQTILLPDSSVEIKPSKVRALTSHRPVVQLSDPSKQYVELMFPVPPAGHDLEYVNFRWKIHYRKGGKDQVYSRLERFDRTRRYQQQGVGGYATDSDFPFAEFSTSPQDLDRTDPNMLWW